MKNSKYSKYCTKFTKIHTFYKKFLILHKNSQLPADQPLDLHSNEQGWTSHSASATLQSFTIFHTKGAFWRSFGFILQCIDWATPGTVFQ
jgi:hypothetical protein